MNFLTQKDALLPAIKFDKNTLFFHPGTGPPDSKQAPSVLLPLTHPWIAGPSACLHPCPFGHSFLFVFLFTTSPGPSQDKVRFLPTQFADLMETYC